MRGSARRAWIGGSDTGNAAGGEPSFPARRSARPRVVVVGSGPVYLSGISYYTHRLAVALAEEFEVGVVLMRRLVPKVLYPGRRRVGQGLSAFTYPEHVPVFDGVDWWGRGLPTAVRFLCGQRPDFVVFQWWTGAVLHTFLVLAAVARWMKVGVVLEIHEIQDVGETRMPLAEKYVRWAFPLLLTLAGGVVIHNEHDRGLMELRYRLRDKPVELIPHGPYDLDRGPTPPAGPGVGAKQLLWFGLIRPFKGVEDLVAAFDGLTDEEVRDLELVLVGETWEGWSLPLEKAAGSRHSGRIKVVNRYVADDELTASVARAHVIVLPYHRSSSSGPLAMAMAHGVPVIVTRVGGLEEEARGYEGVRFVAPRDVDGLRQAIREVAALPWRRFACDRSWVATTAGYQTLFERIRRQRSRPGRQG